MISWFQSPDTSLIFHSSSKITRSGSVISFARSHSSLEYSVPGQEAWSFMLTHRLFTSLAFNDLFFMLLFVLPFPFIRSFSLAEWMKANGFWKALKAFTQGICFCLFFYSLACSKQNFCVFYDILSIVHKSQFIRSFCFSDVICKNLHHPLYSFFGFQSCP